MNFLNIISVFLVAIGGMFALLRQLQMLQQNSYFASRYIKWLFTNFGVRDVFSIVLFCLECFFLFLGLDLFLLAIAILSLLRIKIAISNQKKSIKKLVFTKRIKRTYLCAVLLFSLLISLLFFQKGIALTLLNVLLLILSNFVPLLCFVVLFITIPIEKTISNYFIKDTKKILKNMKNLKIIGITGSYGKTSTKYILGRILSEKFNVLITPESYNTPMGIVRTVREQMLPHTEIFVAEMGAKKLGDIKEICDIVNPSMGVITSIGRQHLSTFKSVENIISTKFELAECVKKNEGVVFLNTDNQHIVNLANNYNHISYGTNDSCQYTAKNISYDRNGISFDICLKEKTLSVTSRLLGIHNALNITAAAAVAEHLGVSDSDIKFAISKLVPVAHRLEMKSYINGCILIDDSYNANPSGCLEAVKILGCFDNMKKILVTPGLIELGDEEYEHNKKLGEYAAKFADVVILVGKKRSIPILDGIRSVGFLEENLYVVDSFFDAINVFSPMCDKKSVVLFENDLPDNYAG